ncbi:ras-like protein family member 11B [Glandiceps talaboti]
MTSYIQNGRRLSRAKVAVLGGGGCGKTALTVRYLTRRYIGEYAKNTGLSMTYKSKVAVDNEEINLEILDTDLPEHDKSVLLESTIKWADAFVLLYSVTDRSSFDTIYRLRRLIERVRRCSDFPAVIVANKKDLEHLRVVTQMDGHTFANELNCSFYEISVSENYEDAENCFENVVRQLRNDHFRSQQALEKRSRALSLKTAHRLTRRKRTVTM